MPRPSAYPYNEDCPDCYKLEAEVRQLRAQLATVTQEREALLRQGFEIAREGSDQQGFEVDLTKLDPTIKVIRFYNSW